MRRAIIAALGLGLATVLVVPAAADGWAMLGGDPTHSGFAEKAPRLPLSLLWRYSLPESTVAALSSPVVDDDCVYFCLDQTVYALDRTTGEEVWTYKAAGALSATPVVDTQRGLLYVGCEDKAVYALDTTTGSRRWDFRTAGAVLASPVLEGDTLYVASTDRSVYAIDLEQGLRKWQFPTGGEIKATPAVLRGTVFAAASDRFVYAIDPGARGQAQLRWRAGLAHPEVFMSVALERGKVIAASGRQLAAFDATRGTQVFSETIGQGILAGTPAIANRRVYVGSTDGSLYCVNANTGQPEWRYPREGVGESIISSPIVRGTYVFVRSEGGQVLALDARKGTLLWQYDMDEPPVLRGGERVALGYTGRLARAGHMSFGALSGGYDLGWHPGGFGPMTGETGPVAAGPWGAQPGDYSSGYYGPSSPYSSGGYYGSPYSGYPPGGSGYYGPGAGGQGTGVQPYVDPRTGAVVTPPGGGMGTGPPGGSGYPGYPGSYGPGYPGGRYGSEDDGDYGPPRGGRYPRGGRFGGGEDEGEYGFGGRYPGGRMAPLMRPPAEFKEHLRSSVAVTEGALFVLGNDGALYAFASDAADSTPPDFRDGQIQVTGQGRYTFGYPVEIAGEDDLPGRYAEDVKIPGAPPIRFSVEVRDDGSGLDLDSIEVRLDGKPAEATFDPRGSILWYTYDPKGVARSLNDGEHVIAVKASDYRGHSRQISAAFTVDNSQGPPSLTPATPYGTSPYGYGSGYPTEGTSPYGYGGYGSGYPGGGGAPGYGTMPPGGYPPGGYYEEE